MKYVEPQIISYSEKDWGEIIEAFASPCTGGIFCEQGTQYSQGCGVAGNYCSPAANYTGSGTTPRPCGTGGAYVGPNSLGA